MPASDPLAFNLEGIKQAEYSDRTVRLVWFSLHLHTFENNLEIRKKPLHLQLAKTCYTQEALGQQRYNFSTESWSNGFRRKLTFF